MSYVLQVFRWVLRKFAAAGLIAVLGLAAGGLWIYLRDNVDFDQWRGDLLRSIDGERARVQAAAADVHRRMDRIAVEMGAEQARGREADKVIAQLHDLESTYDRFIGNPAQQRANAEQLEKMTALRQSLTARIEALKQDFTHATWERDGLDIALGKLDARRQQVDAQRSKLMHYLERTWNYPLGRAGFVLPVKIWVAVALGLYFLGPTAGKLALYFLLAPLIARGRPVRLEQKTGELPEIGESRVATELELRPGERLWVKERFLQASDEGLRRRTKYLLDWRMPLTCLATGLVELVEMSHPGGAAGPGGLRLTLSNQADPHRELAVVTLAPGAALVLRPSFLSGVVVGEGARLRVRRRWQLFRWQAWVTLQFRFFEFAGPGRLIVVGQRGVRAERLEPREGSIVAARRANQDATMGFTPGLDYRPARAETFWSYYRGMNPLFDDLFAGRGVFLCQQIASPGDTQKARRFWSGVWSAMLKVFGL